MESTKVPDVNSIVSKVLGSHAKEVMTFVSVVSRSLTLVDELRRDDVPEMEVGKRTILRWRVRQT